MKSVLRGTVSLLGHKIIKDISFLSTASIFNQAVGLIINIFVARYLGVSDFGLLNYVLSYIMLFSVLAQLGTTNITICEISSEKTPPGEVIGSVFGLRLIGSALAIVLIAGSAWMFTKDGYLFKVTLICSSMYIVDAFRTLESVFIGKRLNFYVSFSIMGQVAVSAVLKVVGIVCGLGLNWFIVVSVLDCFVLAGLLLYFYTRIRREVGRWRWNGPLAWRLFKLSFPLMISSMTVLIYQQLDVVILKNMLSNEVVGNFAVASKFVLAAIVLPQTCVNVLTPLWVKARHESQNTFIDAFVRGSDMIIWGSMLVSLALCLASPWLIRYTYGAQYADAVPILRVLSWKVALAAIAAVSGQYIIINNLQKYAVLRNLWGVGINIALNLALIPVWQGCGSAAAGLAAYLFSGYLAHYTLKSFLPLVKLQNRSFATGLPRVVKMIAANFSAARRTHA